MKNLLAKLAGISGTVWSFYFPLLKSLFADATVALLPLALQIVRELAQSSKSGDFKRNMAVQQLTQAAKDRGIDVAESLIRFTIESAVQKTRL
jgi:hypothetical protein